MKEKKIELVEKRHKDNIIKATDFAILGSLGKYSRFILNGFLFGKGIEKIEYSHKGGEHEKLTLTIDLEEFGIEKWNGEEETAPATAMEDADL
ncbi:MAG: hypothetical protein RR654_11830 [Oscillospiraceae bacterium]